MIVKCIKNTKEEIKSLPIYQELKNHGYGTPYNRYAIEKGNYYVVYAIEKNELDLIYQITEKGISTFPTEHYASFFKIHDSRVSRYWNNASQFNNVTDITAQAELDIISFKQWTDDPLFYYKLVEGEAVPNTFTEKEALSAIDTFKRYKSLMDLEFAMPGVTTFAEYSSKGNWLLCPKCIDAWEEPYINIHEMVKCPKCENTFLNPVKIDANKMLLYSNKMG